MNEEILNRLALLHLVLQWCSAHPELDTALTAGQRICLNQERAALFRALDGIHNGFEQSPIVIEKTERIIFLMRRTKWSPPN